MSGTSDVIGLTDARDRAARERPPVIEVRGLTVMRGGEVAVRDATFTVERGDLLGIVGPNGGGKTTLVKALLGLLPLEKGSVRLFGEDLRTFRDWERVAYVSQDAINFDGTFPLTVRELVGLGRVSGRNLGRRLRQADWAAVDETLEFMGLGGIRERRIAQLSGGQKQRVFVAKALVRNPDVLLLDEPVAGVDADTMERFYQRLSDLNAERSLTILVVSHDLTAVFCRMSSAMCVNRDVHYARITPDLDVNDLLRRGYGEHFHFMFHEHQCQGVFRRP